MNPRTFAKERKSSSCRSTPVTGLDEEDRAALHKALSDSEEDVKAGRLVDADALLRELRSR